MSSGLFLSLVRGSRRPLTTQTRRPAPRFAPAQEARDARPTATTTRGKS